MKLNEMEIKKLIEKLQKGEGTDIEQEKWINDIRESVPAHTSSAPQSRVTSGFSSSLSFMAAIFSVNAPL